MNFLSLLGSPIRRAGVYLLCLAAAGYASCQKNAVAPPPPAPEWKLVWADEFTNNGLPDPSKWDYEEGLVRNNEKQYYTRARLENASVKDGFLTIEGRKEPFQGAGYTSACLMTKGKAAWTYGRFVMRARLPKGSGMWPAFWMLGTDIDQVNWPRCGEIDIMESVGKQANRLHATVHYGTVWPDNHNAGNSTLKNTIYDQFHEYSVEWTAEKLTFFVDQTLYFTFRKTDVKAGQEWAFGKPFYLLVNLALGGTWGGDPDFPPDGIDGSVLPQKYVIDYIRVYQQP